MPGFMQMPQTPMSEGLRTGQTDWVPPLPIIDEDEPLAEVVHELSQYFVDVIEVPHTFEQLRTASVGHILKPLVRSLSDRCHHPGIIAALMYVAHRLKLLHCIDRSFRIVKWHFINVENDERGLFETRGFACEIVAWRFLAHLSEHELIDYLLRELPPVVPPSAAVSDSDDDDEEALTSHLLPNPISSSNHTLERSRQLFEDRTAQGKAPTIQETQQPHHTETWSSRMSESVDDDPTLSFIGLNALEIATVANAKRFLSQRVVQDVLHGIWAGDIIFWESLSVHTRKRAQIYRQKCVLGASLRPIGLHPNADGVAGKQIHTVDFVYLGTRKPSKRLSSPFSSFYTTLSLSSAIHNASLP
ncbi:MAG: hypothetical protein Q9222_004524 [Ikaeria aurantiellina]